MSEILFYIGIILIVFAVVGAIVAGIVLMEYRKRLHEVLEKDYGKEHRASR